MKLRIEAAGTSEPNQPQGVNVDVIMTPSEMRDLAGKLESHSKSTGPNGMQFKCGIGTVHFVRVETKLVELAAPGGVLVKA